MINFLVIILFFDLFIRVLFYSSSFLTAEDDKGIVNFRSGIMYLLSDTLFGALVASLLHRRFEVGDIIIRSDSYVHNNIRNCYVIEEVNLFSYTVSGIKFDIVNKVFTKHLKSGGIYSGSFNDGEIWQLEFFKCMNKEYYILPEWVIEKESKKGIKSLDLA